MKLRPRVQSLKVQPEDHSMPVFPRHSAVTIVIDIGPLHQWKVKYRQLSSHISWSIDGEMVGYS